MNLPPQAQTTAVLLTISHPNLTLLFRLEYIREISARTGTDKNGLELGKGHDATMALTTVGSQFSCGGNHGGYGSMMQWTSHAFRCGQ